MGNDDKPNSNSPMVLRENRWTATNESLCIIRTDNICVVVSRLEAIRAFITAESNIIPRRKQYYNCPDIIDHTEIKIINVKRRGCIICRIIIGECTASIFHYTIVVLQIDSNGVTTSGAHSEHYSILTGQK